MLYVYSINIVHGSKKERWKPRFNSVAKFSPTKLNQTDFLTNKGINSYLFTEGALDFSPT